MTRPGATILFVDDEVMLRAIISEWLEFEGYRVLTAEDGTEALRLMEVNRVDAIVTDVRMPVMDGLTLLRKLKASAEYLPPAILVSGFADCSPREAYDLGVEALISKPFTDDQLLSALRRLFTPGEERWQSSVAASDDQDLQATFLNPLSAGKLGQLAFGRGGFCLRSNANLTVAPVRFAMNFNEDALQIAGQGLVRWIQPVEEQIGVEITGLQADCLAQGLRLTIGSGARSFIPGSSESD